MTAEELRKVLQYDPLTGGFTWKSRQGGRALAGAVAGQVKDKGYRSIQFKGAQYLEHRLAWLYMNGAFPQCQIDHINHIKTDNRWCNLRAATRSENKQNTRVAYINNISGYLGVGWNTRRGMWMARINIDGKQKYLGSFLVPADAHEAYLKAKQELHGASTL